MQFLPYLANVVAICVLVFAVYLPRHHRRDLAVAYLGVNIGVMAVSIGLLDSAVAESFFATLKKELVHHEQYATRAEARASIFEYVEVFYNSERLHSSLGYVAPAAYEQSR